MTWTTPADLRAQVQKLWDKGVLLRPLAQTAAWEPVRLRLTSPTSAELTTRFDAVRLWVAQMRKVAAGEGQRGYRVVWREFRHQVLGSNALPEAVWLDTLDDALAVLGKHKEAQRFTQQLVQITRTQMPVLLPWLEKRPLNALALAEVWPRLLQVVAWVRAHPRPGIYLRQVDVPGVDSKFIEAHRSVLTELLDLALPPDAMDASAQGLSQFCRRYGFLDKPLRVRFRWLDAALALWPNATEHDITLTQTAFAQLPCTPRRVFITENEINFLTFPPVPDSMVIFGAGYGFEALAGARWLQACEVHYWGDIDTHGFAILDQLRATLPHARSLLMDQATLLAHQTLWGEESQPLLRDLPRLTPPEVALFNALRDKHWKTQLRLEQESISMAWVKQALYQVE